MRAADLVFQIGDRRFNLPLAFLGGMVFGIFGKIAVGAGFLDGVYDPGTLLAQQLELGSQLFIAFLEHRQLFNTGHP